MHVFRRHVVHSRDRVPGGERRGRAGGGRAAQLHARPLHGADRVSRRGAHPKRQRAQRAGGHAPRSVQAATHRRLRTPITPALCAWTNALFCGVNLQSGDREALDTDGVWNSPRRELLQRAEVVLQHHSSACFLFYPHRQTASDEEPFSGVFFRGPDIHSGTESHSWAAQPEGCPHLLLPLLQNEQVRLRLRLQD